MELTAEQRAVVDDDAPARLVTGDYASGKTAALVARWRRLADEHGPGRVLYIAAHPGAAADVRRRMVAVSQGSGAALAVGPLAVTTPNGFAADVVRRYVPGLEDAAVVGGAGRRAEVARAFAAESASAWPAAESVVGRRAFLAAVQAGIDALARAEVPIDEVLRNAAVLGHEARWSELDAFRARYQALLRARGQVDSGQLARLAASSLTDAEPERFVELLVDDAERLSDAECALVSACAARGIGLTIACNDRDPRAAAFDGVGARFAMPPALVPQPRLVCCRHPSMEADAVVGELLRAHDDGVAWDDMAVVVPRHSATIARAVVRALQRREVPVQVRLADGDAEPVVRLLRDELVATDPSVPAAPIVEERIHAALRELAASAELVAPDPGVDRALNALNAFDRATRRWCEAQPVGGATVGALVQALHDGDEFTLWYNPGADDGVAVVTPDDSVGRHWSAVVVTSCVEGEYPRSAGEAGWFDAAVSRAGFVADAAERRRVAIAAQRHRFGLAASRSPRAVFVAAPQPGVLVSRYVEHLHANPAEPAWPAAKTVVRQPATISRVALHPTGKLRLSASQLSTYEDCPRRWFYDNALRLADSTSVWADFGTLVHDVLEKFLAPTSTVEYSLDALLGLAEDCWSDDIAAFVPQREQARRELDDVLATWWAMEGEHFDRSNVVAVEHEFDVAVGEHAVRGRIDRVDHDTSRNGIAVADYKTGRHPPKEIDVADDLQLAVYYLAALRSEALAQVGPPSRLELLYVRLGKRLEQAITADHEARAEGRILEAAADILAEHIEPLPTADCDHCDYHRLCPLQKAGREVGVR